MGAASSLSMRIEEAVTSEAVMMPMVARYLRRTRMGSSLHVRLARC